MKKIGLWLAALVAIGILAFVFKPKGKSPAESQDGPSALGSDAKEVFDYKVSIVVRQRIEGQGEQVMIQAEGILQQGLQGELAPDFVSEWKALNDFSLMGRSADPVALAGILKLPILSSIQNQEKAYVHYFPKTFSQELIPFHVSLLQRILLPVPLPELREKVSLERVERDEIGSFNVQYDWTQEGQDMAVRRQWLHYARDGIKVDSRDNTLRYLLSDSGRLLSVEGRLTLHYKQIPPARYTTEIKVEKVGARPADQKPVNREEMQRIGQKEFSQAVAENEERGSMSYEQALEKLQSVTDDTPSHEVYEIFSTIKAEINRDFARAGEIVARIESMKGRDAATMRKLTVLFGALAQAQDSRVADLLADMVDRCEDNFCKVQALAGVNSHPFPSVQAAEKMLSVADGTSDPEVASTALLAAGAAGRRLEDIPSLPQHLLKDLNDPKKEIVKSSVLAAMGNHGSPEYLPALQAYVEAKDSRLRAAAVYSLRYLPQDSVNGSLLAIVQKDGDVNVVKEAVKAIEYRDLAGSEYQALAQRASDIPNADLQQFTARVLLQVYREDAGKAEESLRILREESKFPDVKAYIEGELKQIKADQAAANAEAVTP